MRVTILSALADMSGGSRVLATYAALLSRRGHSVTVVSRPLPKPTFTNRMRILRHTGHWPRHCATLPSHYDGLPICYKVLEQWRPIAATDVPDADVLITTWWETAQWASNFPAAKGAKVYFIQHHEVEMEGQPAAAVAATWRLPMHRITISRWLVDIARNTYGLSDIALIPNAVDTNVFAAPPRSKQAHPTVGLTYASAAFKRTGPALRITEQLHKQFPDLKLVVFGSMPPEQSLPIPAFGTYVQNPPQKNIAQLYAQCDVWLCASRSEGFGLPILEAMACRCPVVSSRVGGATDLVQDGANGFLVNVEDDEAMLAKAGEILRRPPQAWRAMSDAAYKAATAWSWDAACDRFEAELERAIANQAGRQIPAGSQLASVG